MPDAVIDQAVPVREGEMLDQDKLAAYLQTQLDGQLPPLRIEQFPSGFSNLTYLLTLGDRQLVLRRPPFGNPVKSAHDMSREYRVLSRLSVVYPPAPRPLFFCDDPAIIGDDFYVMERRHGVVLRGPGAPGILRGDEQMVRALCESFIDNLATLHTLDYQSAGLGELGKPEGYVERQVTGWGRRYQDARTDDHPEMDELGSWLVANQPTDCGPALIHNDYKYDNLMLDAGDLTRIIAVLDWEMATIGDPLMDLGTTLAYWIEPTDPVEMHARAFGPTMLPGSMTRQQLLARYSQKTGLKTDRLHFYCGYGLFKLAVIIQQIYARYVRGNTQDPRFADLNGTVADLARRGLQVIQDEAV
jgi:aminoglycoside phosphotransferase (APT) family kinase protein